jgi:hypothetical protein
MSLCRRPNDSTPRSNRQPQRERAHNSNHVLSCVTCRRSDSAGRTEAGSCTNQVVHLLGARNDAQEDSVVVGTSRASSSKRREDEFEDAGIALLLAERLANPSGERRTAAEFLTGIGMERFVARLPTGEAGENKLRPL